MRGRTRRVRALVVGLLLPGVATLLAVLPVETSTATAALVYVLAVTAAATVGGLAAGLVASVLSFLGLNFFFTRPFHTFVVTKGEDLVALVVFLLISATIGTLISTALAHRMRAERREDEAREAREDAEVNRTRAALFSSVTHDLRTPLASITASVTGLLADDSNYTAEDRKELLGAIYHEAERLNRVVGNLLDLSRMRAGALVPSKSLAGMEEVVEAVVRRLDPVLNGHEVVLSLPDEVPDVPMDIVQMDQVLTNLLENAARFSDPGTRIDVGVEVLADAVRVGVADEGRGIAHELRERVFEPFVRDERSPGTGLGLAISRAIVEAHQGKIWLEDGAARGTRVVFQLPLSN